MLWNAKNGSVPLDDTEMSFVSFGYGTKPFIILPGLSDGLMTVSGKALMLAKPYKLFFENYTVYMFSRKNVMPEGYSAATGYRICKSTDFWFGLRMRNR